MHELSLCEQVLAQIEAQAQQQGFTQVKTVCLEIGKLSCVESEAMRFCFDQVVADSIAEGAILKIEQPQGIGWCGTCLREVVIEQRYDACPHCGLAPLVVRNGEQMRIDYLEVI